MGRTAYYYDADVGNFYYAQGHPMKPHRMRMTHNLLVAYGLVDRLDVFTPPRASERDMTRFHADEYISFLKLVTPESVAEHHSALSRFNVLEDCPVFDGLWEYCQIAAGGSLAILASLASRSTGLAGYIMPRRLRHLVFATSTTASLQSSSCLRSTLAFCMWI
jgi:histone deacetylase 1/2